MAKPTSTSALKTRLQALDTELEELQAGAYALSNSRFADGFARTIKEMRKALNRAKEQGDLAKL